METIDKVEELAAMFLRDEMSGTYFRSLYDEKTEEDLEFKDALTTLLTKEIGDTDLFSVVDNSVFDCSGGEFGVISVAFLIRKLVYWNIKFMNGSVFKMLNTVDKIYDIADRFAQFKEPDGTTYFRAASGEDFVVALSNFFLESPITAYSVVNIYDAVNSGVISVAFIDEDGTLRHENFPWWEEC